MYRNVLVADTQAVISEFDVFQRIGIFVLQSVIFLQEAGLILRARNLITDEPS